MPRIYDTKVVALAVGVTDKWLDNLLSHLDLPGVAQGRQGVRRSITDEGLSAIELTRSLAEEFGMPLESAVRVARRAIEVRSSRESRVSVSSGIALLFPLAAIEQRLHGQMVQAVESVAQVRRGRPRKVTASGRHA